MLEIYNNIRTTGNVPDSFLESVKFPIYKKGNTNEVKHYRGVSFMNVDSKIFAGILLNRLDRWIEKNQILNQFQAGFRKGILKGR